MVIRSSWPKTAFAVLTLLSVAAWLPPLFALTEPSRTDVPQKPSRAAHSAAALAVDGETIATGQNSAAANPLMAVLGALQKCEEQRVAKNIATACEPVRVDKENISSAAELREQAEQQPGAMSLFEFKGRRSKVYLFGSIHLMKKNMYPLDSAITERFERADNLVVEINTEAIPAGKLQKEFTHRGLLPAGSTLMEQLAPATVEQVQGVLRSRGYGIEAFQQMRPWFFEQTFVAQEMLTYGYDATVGIDKYFVERAIDGGKPVLEFETLQEQLDILSLGSVEEQDLSLRHTFELLGDKSVQGDLNALVVAWLRGDVNRMYQFMTEPVQEYPQLKAFITRLLDDRNVMMAKKIRRWLRGKGTYFIVVGAGHLGGPNGLVELLERKGYKAQQVMR